MRIKIARGIRGAEIDKALPKRYAGVASAAVRRLTGLEVLSSPDSYVVTSADVSRTLQRLGTSRGASVVAFMYDATVEALAALRAAGVKTFTLRSSGWSDERYRAIRQTRSHEHDRGPGGLPK
jgi:hypothetical protein